MAEKVVALFRRFARAQSEHVEAPLAEDEYYQRFIAEPSFGAVFIARDETAHLLGISRHLRALPASNTPEFRYAGSLGPVAFGEPLQTEIERLGNVLAKQFQLRGWFGIDFILDQNEQLWVLEVNPRYTASVEVLERAANVSSASLHLQACVGEPLAEDILALFRGKLPWVGKSILYAQHSTHATPEAWLQRSISRHDLADIPAYNTQSKAGDPLLTIFATGESEQEVLLALQAKAHELSNPPE